ncbi:MAG: hypothetical protein LBJ79_02525 [Endomicrobium sp.]|nr:hypothetical protein [Endomicrobium sp.]
MCYNLNDVEILDKEALQRVWEEKSVELGKESESEEIFFKKLDGQNEDSEVPF